MPCSFGHERALQKQGTLLVAGIDEAGRGPLAGPVVAAAVVFLEFKRFNGLTDSKKLAPEFRATLFERITCATHIRWAVSVQDAATIDSLNILRATHKAMREALEALSSQPDHVLIDGLPIPNFPAPHTAVIGGDGLSLSIAAASVVAKVTRDRIMEEMDALYPQYGFRRHKGYATPEHLAALRAHGPSPLHRFSFSPVAQPELF
ncbi:MAG: ribonuclease HII [Terrimicrobiaceae bacterium]